MTVDLLDTQTVQSHKAIKKKDNNGLCVIIRKETPENIVSKPTKVTNTQLKLALLIYESASLANICQRSLSSHIILPAMHLLRIQIELHCL